MYHCHIHFYFAGHPCRAFEIVKEMSPLVPFTHGFSESDRPEEKLTAQADVILVMKDGCIVEQGDHETLLKKGGFYARLYNSQFAVT